jgi:hypothetical protein
MAGKDILHTSQRKLEQHIFEARLSIVADINSVFAEHLKSSNGCQFSRLAIQARATLMARICPPAERVGTTQYDYAQDIDRQRYRYLSRMDQVRPLQLMAIEV